MIKTKVNKLCFYKQTNPRDIQRLDCIKTVFCPSHLNIFFLLIARRNKYFFVFIRLYISFHIFILLFYFYKIFYFEKKLYIK